MAHVSITVLGLLPPHCLGEADCLLVYIVFGMFPIFLGWTFFNLVVHVSNNVCVPVGGVCCRILYEGIFHVMFMLNARYL